MIWFAQAVERLTMAMAVVGLGYYLAAILAAWVYKARLRNEARLASAQVISHPTISILKPLKGLDPSIMEAFRSHCNQRYPGAFELIFGVASLEDPAVIAVEELQREYPQIAIKLIHAPERLGANGKVSTLVQMLPEARYEVVLINDSDILVTPNYLTRVAEAFALGGDKGRPVVGMVTALYRGRPHKTVWSWMESLGIATDFMPSVMMSRWLEGIKFAFGSTLAVRREALEKMGGLAQLVDHLADDYELGKRVYDAGYSVRICGEVVETGIAPYDFDGFISHQLRWARTVRDARPGGYIGLSATHGLAWAMMAVIASGLNPLAVWIFVMVFLLRIALAMEVGAGVLGDHTVLPGLILLPVRDALHFVLWCVGFAGKTIHWRGEEFVLNKGVLKSRE